MREQIEWAKTETSDSKNSKNQHTYVTSSLKNLYSTGKNLKKWLPWHSTLAKIETKYGGSFVSLFELNRWLFIINFIVALLAGSFIIAPQYAYSLDETSNRLDINNNGTNLSETCKNILVPENNQNRTDFLESSTSNSSIEESLLLSKCCYYNYTKYLQNRDKNKTTVDTVLDIFQGTGIFEESFFFYGQYSNKTTIKVKNTHVYYMGLSFASITLMSLIISAIGLLVRTAKIIDKNTDDELRKFLKIYRETPHSTTKVAPAMLLFGFAHTSGIPQIDTMSFEKIKELHEFARGNDEEAKKRMNKDFDLIMNARETQIKVGARVLLKVERKVKSDPTWDPTPYTVITVKGTMITAKRGNRKVTRNVSLFKTFYDIGEKIDNDPKIKITRKSPSHTQPVPLSQTMHDLAPSEHDQQLPQPEPETQPQLQLYLAKQPKSGETHKKRQKLDPSQSKRRSDRTKKVRAAQGQES